MYTETQSIAQHRLEHTLTPADTKILTEVRRAKARGLICEEIEEGLGVLHQSASAALTRLRQKGLVKYAKIEGENESTYRYRNTSTGRKAHVYKAT